MRKYFILLLLSIFIYLNSFANSLYTASILAVLKNVTTASLSRSNNTNSILKNNCSPIKGVIKNNINVNKYAVECSGYGNHIILCGVLNANKMLVNEHAFLYNILVGYMGVMLYYFVCFLQTINTVYQTITPIKLLYIKYFYKRFFRNKT